MKTIRGLNVRGKRVLVRSDFNVPLSPEGDILDDFKIRQTLPTINYLVRRRARIILMSHLDDPGGRVIERLRLDRIQKRLEKHLGQTVLKAADCVGPEVRNLVKKMKPGQVLLLENLRFHAAEEKGSLRFTKKLAELGDVFLNDAFAVSHRDHASLKVARVLPSGAGLLLTQEIQVLTRLRDNPRKPLVVILGGQAKGLETKLRLINRYAGQGAWVLLANLVADELERRKKKLSSPAQVICPVDSVRGYDIGQRTLKSFRKKIAKAKTIFWSGPLGWIEKKKYSRGSQEVARAIIQSRAFSVAGGGETSWFLRQRGLAGKFNHLSTGGDALLLFLAGEKLPGIEALG
ncbi:MAG: phosphoglycerate kinase [Candidatus Nealsonbacteria bacterium]|nr:phosphoglycerate kinase [Candidatus Nealsonbacteria bacterium]